MAILLNFFGIVLVTFTILVVWMVTKPEFKRRYTMSQMETHIMLRREKTSEWSITEEREPCTNPSYCCSSVVIFDSKPIKPPSLAINRRWCCRSETIDHQTNWSTNKSQLCAFDSNATDLLDVDLSTHIDFQIWTRQWRQFNVSLSLSLSLLLLHAMRAKMTHATSPQG